MLKTGHFIRVLNTYYILHVHTVLIYFYVIKTSVLNFVHTLPAKRLYCYFVLNSFNNQKCVLCKTEKNTIKQWILYRYVANISTNVNIMHIE